MYSLLRDIDGWRSSSVNTPFSSNAISSYVNPEAGKATQVGLMNAFGGVDLGGRRIIK
jgi:hypothetical protein